ncbi:21741_t:CDS:2 [Entrophospora sp. SA101]|nr:21741_t:CDS:2 [Entrophospora sp. SA101]
MSVDDLSTVEEWINTKDGVPLYTKTWKSVSESPVATVVFLHGFGEHINRYNHVFEKFQLKNIEVYAFDQRGFGNTAVKNKNPGISGGWKVSMVDITEALIRKRRKGTPQFLFGHSMGGALALNYACEGSEKNNLAGVISSSPLVSQAVQTKSSPSVVTIGSALSRILPGLTIPVDLNSNYLSKDPGVVESYSNDPLVHGMGSLLTLNDMLKGGEYILKNNYKNITIPIYISHGSGDLITCPNTSKQLYEKIPATDKTFHEWPGCYHEPHNEPEKDQVIEGWIQWILDHAKNGHTEDSQTTQTIQSTMNVGLASA